jgi:hypothetical protein
MWNWLNAFRARTKQTIPAHWLAPNDNPWGLAVLDCTHNACTTMSTTANIEIAKKYNSLRNLTGEELQNELFNPALTITCSLLYNVAKRAPDGPVFKSQIMEEKWDIYFYGDHLYFCRSWGGELFYRVALECEPPTMKVSLIEASHKINEKSAVRDVDFLIKSHVLSAKALHPLPREIGRNTQKLALYSFSAYGRMGLYGTFEETIGTPCYEGQSLPNLS